jgi:beta-aspartyl-peptidase (threonine type)
MQPSLIVHGGAWNIPDNAVPACREGCRRALKAGWAVLSQGGEAIDAVQAAIMVLEDDPVFDAGTGAHLNRDGHVELDAIVMDGTSLESGAVAAVTCTANPILLARRVLEASPHMMLVGAGADQFAREEGVRQVDPSALIVDRERALWQRCRVDVSAPNGDVTSAGATGTVGAVARDARGRLVAGTSTGGTAFKHRGRVGDSPLIGCGCYADSEAGAVSATGEGEAIMRIVMAKMAVEMLRAGQPPQAVGDACLRVLRERGRGRGGLILVDAHGTTGFGFTTPRMACAYVAADGSLVVPEMGCD